MAVPFLETVVLKTDVQAVVTMPDQPAGRGYAVKAPEVKVAAENLKIPVLQPPTLKDSAVADQLKAMGLDFGVVVADRVHSGNSVPSATKFYETTSRLETADAGSTHLPCSRIKSCNRSTASASGILNLTAVLPT